MRRKRKTKSTNEQSIHCLIMDRIFIQLDVGSFTMCSMPGGFVDRQANTSFPIPRSKKTISTETRDQSLQDSKNTGSLLSASTTGLCQERPPCLGVFSLLSFPLERALLWAIASEIPTCESFSRMAPNTLHSSSNILGAFSLDLTRPTARP